MEGRDRVERFQRTLLPHMQAAYNLARYLVRDDHDAEDIVQEAYLRALNFFDSFRGGDGRTWLLTIVRNTCYTWLRRHRRTPAEPFDEGIHGAEASDNPESLLLAKADSARVRAALEELPLEYREALVLREMEGLTYHQIAETTGAPLGTVMSRLARGRQKLAQILTRRAKGLGAQ